MSVVGQIFIFAAAGKRVLVDVVVDGLQLLFFLLTMLMESGE
jgi:hypothetical protein